MISNSKTRRFSTFVVRFVDGTYWAEGFETAYGSTFERTTDPFNAKQMTGKPKGHTTAKFPGSVEIELKHVVTYNEPRKRRTARR